MSKLGKTPIGEITAPKLIDVMRPVEASGRFETVKRVNQRINKVMVYAVNTGIIHTNPSAGVKAAFKSPEKRNMPTLEPHELPEFLERLQDASLALTTKWLIRWQLHTMTRPAEAAGARWDEIKRHSNGRVDWVIPAERKLFFPKLTRLQDRFAGQYPSKLQNMFEKELETGSSITYERLRAHGLLSTLRNLFINCWTSGDFDSEMHWSRYGGAETAIAIVSSVGSLRASLSAPPNVLQIKRVKYVDFSSDV
ncbi:tyrosine-type recombinase/integrase [Aliidiomarina maris]|uniref:Phage integrase central domain-containing protein n=2 Tax=Aliidiomarina maris TaxID=531312 RepID=A0A327X6S6_9GAMM|nr:hypothetical protein B0I24_101216 [Aliidiomarina maris]